MSFYVEVSEHATEINWIPFTPRASAPRVPGRFESGRLFGPYTAAGAERVARAALANVSGTVGTYPASGYRYATDDNGTRVVKVWERIPFHWTRVSVTRNMPRGY